MVTSRKLHERPRVVRITRRRRAYSTPGHVLGQFHMGDALGAASSAYHPRVQSVCVATAPHTLIHRATRAGNGAVKSVKAGSATRPLARHP